MPCRELNITDYFCFSEGKQALHCDSTRHWQLPTRHYLFGKITKTTGSIANRFVFRFSSEYQDTESGLVYYNYRYYSPELGRWLSRDPIGEKGGVNLYAMVGNGLVYKTDYLGNASVTYHCTFVERIEAHWVSYCMYSCTMTSCVDSAGGVPCKICIKEPPPSRMIDNPAIPTIIPSDITIFRLTSRCPGPYDTHRLF